MVPSPLKIKSDSSARITSTTQDLSLLEALIETKTANMQNANSVQRSESFRVQIILDWFVYITYFATQTNVNSKLHLKTSTSQIRCASYCLQHVCSRVGQYFARGESCISALSHPHRMVGLFLHNDIHEKRPEATIIGPPVG